MTELECDLSAGASLETGCAHFLEEWHRLTKDQQSLPLGICLSAGSDSSALAFIAKAASLALPQLPPVTLLHVRHELRGQESHGDALSCRQIASRLSFPLLEISAPVVAGADLEARARKARYQGLRSSFPGLLITAHHSDDQAETVLLRLLRGAGPIGLCSISPVRDDGIWRPLLAMPRSQLQGILAESNWIARQDSSNQDQSFTRNLLRHTILPEWESREPGITSALCRLARSAQELKPFLMRRLDQLESLTRLIVTPHGFRMEPGKAGLEPDHPEWDLLLERTWTRTGRRPWSRSHRTRLLADVMDGKCGTRLGGQSENASFGSGILSIERLNGGQKPREDGFSQP
jgi:tRNA(Ile)-lysidine synthetase-like protein